MSRCSVLIFIEFVNLVPLRPIFPQSPAVRTSYSVHFTYISSISLGLLDATCIEMPNMAPGGGAKCPTGSDEED